MASTQEETAEILLELGAVRLNYAEPFRYASGMLSPIYCDNRILISHPEQRKQVISGFLEALEPIDFDLIAGVATSGIPWAAWIAGELGKPLVYIRSKAKEHGTSQQLEGEWKDGQTAVVIEDLISTGGSSASAVKAAKEAGLKVSHCIAIFTYGMAKAAEAFKGLCEVITLSDFNTLIAKAKETGKVTDEEAGKITEWNQDPEGWGKKMGFE